jgi:hypothetical protein
MTKCSPRRGEKVEKTKNAQAGRTWRAALHDSNTLRRLKAPHFQLWIPLERHKNRHKDRGAFDMPFGPVAALIVSPSEYKMVKTCFEIRRSEKKQDSTVSPGAPGPPCAALGAGLPIEFNPECQISVFDPFWRSLHENGIPRRGASTTESQDSFRRWECILPDKNI